MSPRTKYRIGTAILLIAIVLIIVELLGMTGVIPKYVPTRSLNLTAIAFLLFAAIIRRHARAEMASPSPSRD